MNRNLNQQSGMVIVLAVLIIAAVLSSAIIFGDFIIREIQQSRLLDDSIQAYYVAESGSEHSLYQLRKREAVVDCSVVGPTSVCDNISGLCSGSTVSCITSDQGNLSVKAPWSVVVSNEDTLAIPLSPGESFQIDLFDPSDIASSNVNQVEINTQAPSLDILLELTNLTKVFALNDIELQNCLLQQPVAKTRLTGPTPQFIESIDNQTLFQECSYVLKLNWPQNAIGNSSVFSLTLHNKFNNPEEALPIPSRLIMRSEATFGKSFQVVTVRTPVRPPLSGIYDFVLFSEQSIIK